MASTAPPKDAEPAKRKRAAENILLSFVKRARLPNEDDNTTGNGNENANATTASSAPSLADDTESVTTTAFTTASGKSKSRPKSGPRPKIHPCTHPGCDKSFSRPVHLRNHMNSHTGERPHACSEEGCDKAFLKREHLIRHIQEKHGSDTFVCTFTTRNHISGELEPCNKQFASAQKYKRHFAIHEQKEETTCSWENCNMVFRKQETLQRHIKKDHLHEDSYMCSRTNSDGEVCGELFPTPGLLRSHVHREHEPPKHYCKICTCAANPLTELDVLPTVKNELDPEFLPPPEDTLSHREGVDSADVMQNLSLNDQPVMLPAEAIVSFPTYHELQRHMTLVHPPTCSECGKKCKTAKDLTAHIDIHHPSDGQRVELEKKFVCPYNDCPRADIANGFHKKGNMAAHVKTVHAVKKKFICGEFDLSGNEKVDRWNGKGCGAALTTKQSLINHIRTQHLGIPISDKATGKTIVPRPKRGKKSPLSQQSLPGAEDDYEDAEESDGDGDEAEADYDQMDVDQPTKKPSVALTMLTGSGYDELRPIACLTSGCSVRFNTVYEMSFHLELTHGWNVDDINEATGREDAGFRTSEELQKQNSKSVGAIARGDSEFLSSDELLRRKLEASGRVDPQLT